MRAGLRGFVAVELLPEFERRVAWQAAIRDVDGPMPWPEELERPGWRTLEAPEGETELRLLRERGVGARYGEEAATDPRQLTELETVTVLPQLEAEVETDGARWWVGLGWHVGTRTLALFHGLARERVG